MWRKIVDRIRSMVVLGDPRGSAGRKPHRRITVLASDPAVGRAMVQQWLEAMSGHVRPLRPASNVEAFLGSANEAAQLDGQHVSHRRTERRPQRWRIRVPVELPNHETKERPDDLDADTYVVVWPHAWLLDGAPKVGAAAAALDASIGFACKHGRLKRVAFVVVGCPTAEQPLHRDQARFEVRPYEGLAACIHDDVELAKDQCGDAMADPRWSAFLERRVGADRTFAALVDGAADSLGRTCPVFFASATRASHLEALLSWIRRSGRTAQRGEAFGRIACQAAAVLLVVAGVLAMLVPDPRRGGASLVYAREALVDSTLQQRRASSAGPRGWAVEVLEGASGRRALEEAASLVREGEFLRRHEFELRQALAAAADSVDRAAPAERTRRAARLLELANAHLAHRATWNGSHAQDREGLRRIAGWDQKLRRTIVDAWLLSLGPRDEGFQGFAIAVDLDRQSSTAVRALPEGSGLAAALGGLARETSGYDFYSAWLRLEGSTTHGALARSCEAFVPRMQVTPDAGSRGANLPRWTQLHRQLGPEHSARFIRGPGALIERLASDASGAANPARDMEIVFRAPDLGGNWHLDVWLANGDYVPTRWLVQGDPSAGRTALLEGVARMSEIRVALNRSTASHITGGSLGERCRQSVPGTLVLADPAGVARIGAWEIQYQVTSGWESPAGVVEAKP